MDKTTNHFSYYIYLFKFLNSYVLIDMCITNKRGKNFL